MSEEVKKPESKIMSAVGKLFGKGGGKPREDQPPPSTGEFRYFTLVPIPETAKKDVETFNDEVAAWVNRSLQNKPNISFLEMYLTRTAMSRLNREVSIEANIQSLVEHVDGRLPGADDNGGRESSRVAFSQMGLLITPALQRVFDGNFIARQIVPPQLYAPPDESEIPPTVDQFLIGSLKIEDARRRELGETPIRALLNRDGERGRILPLYTHADFDILLKAFPDEEFCAYPLGVYIDCRLEMAGGSRRVRQVDLDLHDTKLLASKSQGNERSRLFYYLLEGGNVQKDISDVPEVYHVPMKSESALKSALKSGEVDDTYEIVPGSGLRVPVAGKVGMQVVLKYTGSDGQLHTDTYKFLFRFFRSALRFNTETNRLSAGGQFVRGSGETVVMLPPSVGDGRTEVQTPAFIVSAVEGDGAAFDIRRHPDSSLVLTVEGNALAANAVRVNIADPVEIRGEIGAVGDSLEGEKFKFTLRALDSLNDQRKKVAEFREGQNYSAFVEIASDRSISLARREVVLGRNQLLGRDTGVGLNALTLKQQYITWVMKAKKDEKVLYYSKVRGMVAQPVTELTKELALGLVATYYVYVGDFEFIIFLESTPWTEVTVESSS